MRPAGRASHRAGAVAALAGALSFAGAVQADQPVVVTSAASTKITITSASLGEAIDALARTAGFKVTYEGGRPNAMLYKTEVDTPSVAESLARLLDGQNLNYGIVFDLTGRKVTLLMVLGPAIKPAGGTAAGAAGAASRPQPFATPRSPRNEPPPEEDDAQELAAEPEPTPSPTPAASPSIPPRNGPISPFQPPSPFGPRPIGVPPGGPPRPSPTPSP